MGVCCNKQTGNRDVNLAELERQLDEEKGVKVSLYTIIKAQAAFRGMLARKRIAEKHGFRIKDGIG